MLRRIEVGQVPERVAEGVAKLPVCLRQALEDLSDRRTSSLNSTEDDPQPNDFGAVLLDDFSGSIALPSDFDMARPSASSVKPWVSALAIGSADPAGRRRSAASCGTSRGTGRRLPGTCRVGQGRPFLSVSTARWLEPESNQTSRMSFSLRSSAPPHFGHSRHRRISSAAVASYQTSALCSRNRSTTRSRTCDP